MRTDERLIVKEREKIELNQTIAINVGHRIQIFTIANLNACGSLQRWRDEVEKNLLSRNSIFLAFRNKRTMKYEYLNCKETGFFFFFFAIPWNFYFLPCL